VTKEEREWAERFEQLREEFWERYRQARHWTLNIGRSVEHSLKRRSWRGG